MSLAIAALKRACPWMPTQAQLDAATNLASAFYAAGQEEAYSPSQFEQDVETARASIANDNVFDSVAGLTQDMRHLLHAYGEDADWHALTPEGYKAWASN